MADVSHNVVELSRSDTETLIGGETTSVSARTTQKAADTPLKFFKITSFYRRGANGSSAAHKSDFYRETKAERKNWHQEPGKPPINKNILYRFELEINLFSFSKKTLERS